MILLKKENLNLKTNTTATVKETAHPQKEEEVDTRMINDVIKQSTRKISGGGKEKHIEKKEKKKVTQSTLQNMNLCTTK